MREKKGLTEVPEALGELESAQLHTWAREQYRGLTTLEIRELVAECLDWHRANGRRRVDWPATARNWIRKEMRFQRRRGRVQAQEQKPKLKLAESAPAQVHSLLDRILK